MSGSNNDTYSPPSSTEFDCVTSVITTDVSSIDLDVLRKHKVDDKLTLDINEKEALILVDGDGEILGSIIHLNKNDIVNCIKNGSSYKAEIIYIKFPKCTVKINHI